MDTGETAIFSGSSGPPFNQSLEANLLARWDHGAPAFDALLLRSLPGKLDWANGSAMPALTILTNQSAVAALPAALNQATSALLRYLLAGTSTPASEDGVVANQADAVAASVAESDCAAAPTSGRTLWPAWPERGCTDHNKVTGTSATGGSRRWLFLPPPRLDASSAHLPGDLPGSTSLTAGGDGAQPLTAGGDGAHPLTAGFTPAWSPPPLPDLPSITVVDDPLPLLGAEPVVRMRQDAGALVLVLCLTLGSSVLSAGYVVTLVR